MAVRAQALALLEKPVERFEDETIAEITLAELLRRNKLLKRVLKGSYVVLVDGKAVEAKDIKALEAIRLEKGSSVVVLRLLSAG